MRVLYNLANEEVSNTLDTYTLIFPTTGVEY
ncbi:MAG: hypothetical protein ACI857_003167 [Arenicella sp.]